MVKNILFIILLLFIILILFFTQDQKKEVTKKPPNKQEKIKIDYSINPKIEEKIKLKLPNNKIIDQKNVTGKYIKPKDIKEKIKLKDDLEIDGNVNFNKEEKTIDGVSFKLKKSF